MCVCAPLLMVTFFECWFILFWILFSFCKMINWIQTHNLYLCFFTTIALLSLSADNPHCFSPSLHPFLWPPSLHSSTYSSHSPSNIPPFRFNLSSASRPITIQGAWSEPDFEFFITLLLILRGQIKETVPRNLGAKDGVALCQPPIYSWIQHNLSWQQSNQIAKTLILNFSMTMIWILSRWIKERVPRSLGPQ